MKSQRILGLILFVLGVGFLYFGLNATDSVTEHVNEGLTGKYTDETTWYLLAGLAMALVGSALAMIGGGTKSHTV